MLSFNIYKPTLYPILGLWAYFGRVPIKATIETEKSTPHIERIYKEQRKKNKNFKLKGSVKLKIKN